MSRVALDTKPDIVTVIIQSINMVANHALVNLGNQKTAQWKIALVLGFIMKKKVDALEPAVEVLELSVTNADLPKLLELKNATRTVPSNRTSQKNVTVANVVIRYKIFVQIATEML